MDALQMRLDQDEVLIPEECKHHISSHSRKHRTMCHGRCSCYSPKYSKSHETGDDEEEPDGGDRCRKHFETAIARWIIPWDATIVEGLRCGLVRIL